MCAWLVRFLKKVAKAYLRRTLHVVLDNYHTHKHDDINQWLANNPPSDPAFHTLVGILAQPGRGVLRHHHRQAIRRGSFDSGTQLVGVIRTFIDGWNNRCQPFTWTKTAEQILPHATRKRGSNEQHSLSGAG